MVQPNYSPQEALERVKLMMKYDTSKTLNENKQSINEDEKNLNTVTDADLIGSTNWFRSYIQTISDFSALGLPNIYDIIGVNLPNLIAGRRQGMKGIVDALDGFVDSKDLTYVLTVIKGLDGKCYYDDVEGKSISATERLIQLYQEDEGEDLKTEVNGVGTRTLPTGTDKIKQQIAKTIDSQIAKGCSSTKEDGNKTPNRNPVKTPPELKDVKAFQDWLDNYHGDDKEGQGKGWATGYKDGIINKGQNGKGYGFYGPRTQKAWATYKDQYLKGDTAAGTPAAPVTKPDEIEQVDAEDSTDLLK